MSEQNFLQEFGRRLRYLRKAKGLKQAELAQKIDKTQDAISGYEKGTRSVQLKELPALANALDVSVPSLFQDITNPYFPDELLEGLRTYIYQQDSRASELLDKFGALSFSMDSFIEILYIGLEQYFEQKVTQEKHQFALKMIEIMKVKLDNVDLTPLEKVLLIIFDDLTLGKSDKEKSTIFISNLLLSVHKNPEFWFVSDEASPQTDANNDSSEKLIG